MIGTIHKHQNFKKLTPQATTKQILVELIQNHKSYETKRSISHNPKSEACITYFWNIFKKKYPYQNIIPAQEIDSIEVLDHNQNN